MRKTKQLLTVQVPLTNLSLPEYSTKLINIMSSAEQNSLHPSFNNANDLVQKLNEYIKVQNSSTSTLQDMEMTFEGLFHDDLELHLEGGGFGQVDAERLGPRVGKAEAKRMIFKDFMQKAKLAFDKIGVIDNDHIEIVISKENDWRRHQVLTVKDGKIVKLETVTDVNDLVYNLHAYMKVYSCPDSTLEDMSKAFESICHDNFEASIKDDSGLVLGKADAKEIVFKDFAHKTKLALEKLTVLDQSHVDTIFSKEGERRHRVLTVKDGKISVIEAVNDTEEGESKVTFDIKPSYHDVSAQ